MVLRLRSALASALLLAPVSLSALGCDSAPPAITPPADAGPPDTGPPDAAPPWACDVAMSVMARMDDTVSVMLDTAMTSTRPRDLGPSCGNTSGELRWSPQQVLEITLPGTGPVALEVTTVTGGTDFTFNTVLQVRRECTRVPEGRFPPTCFDNTSMAEIRSTGGAQLMGGDTVYLFVTGYAEPPSGTDRGQVQVDITARANTPPTLTRGTFRLSGADAILTAEGMDPDGDVLGVAMNFLVGDRLLDIYGDGAATESGSVFVVPFNPRATGTAWRGGATVLGSQVNLAAYLRNVGATAVRFRVFDEGYATSAPVDVPIGAATTVGFGDACDGEMRLCMPGLVCGAAMVCEAGPAVGAACMAGVPIVIDTPTMGVATTTSVTGTTGTGMGSFSAMCGLMMGMDASGGPERIYVLTVPDGAFDVLLTTDLPGSATTDTFIHARRMCADPRTEVACNDDIDTPGRNYRSRAEIRDAMPGEYAIFVETFNGVGGPHELGVTLRPVLAMGAACDMAGVMNRCATGACTGGMCP